MGYRGEALVLVVVGEEVTFGCLIGFDVSLAVVYL